MSGLKTLRTRMNSIIQTEKITSAMKMISVPKLRKAHAALSDAYAYADESNRIVRRLVRSVIGRQEQIKEQNLPETVKLPLLLTGHKNGKKHLVVVATSDEGLCGQFNQSIIAKTELVLNQIKANDEKPFILCFGYKGGEILKKKNPDIPVHLMSGRLNEKKDAFDEARKLATLLIDSFYSGIFDICTVVYSRFQSAAVQKIQIEQLIPVTLFHHQNKWQFLIDMENPLYAERSSAWKSKIKTPGGALFSAIGGKNITSPLLEIDSKNLLEESTRPADSYDYAPQDTDLLEDFLPSYMSAYVYKILLETTASENASRMMAMENASNSATEMLQNLNKLYHRKRQEKITTDIIEEISGGLIT